MVDTVIDNSATAPRGLKPYGSPLNLGHKLLTNLFKGAVIVEEKIDGSQFSAGWFPSTSEFKGGLRCRSRGSEVELIGPGAMFKQAVESFKAQEQELKIGFTYRCEVVSKLRHNLLTYQRVPKKGFVVFDIEDPSGHNLTRAEKEAECLALGFEIVPLVYQGEVDGTKVAELLAEWFNRESLLGGPIEGVVIKNYSQFNQDGLALMAKVVSAGFKETKPVKKVNLVGDLMVALAQQYRTEARWRKAVQHLQESGQLMKEPKDIGPLCAEIQRDVWAEAEPAIKDQVMGVVRKGLAKALVEGFADWYKALLANPEPEPVKEEPQGESLSSEPPPLPPYDETH